MNRKGLFRGLNYAYLLVLKNTKLLKNNFNVDMLFPGLVNSNYSGQLISDKKNRHYICFTGFEFNWARHKKTWNTKRKWINSYLFDTEIRLDFGANAWPWLKCVLVTIEITMIVKAMTLNMLSNVDCYLWLRFQ